MTSASLSHRASDDIEGELGHQLDACMHSAISQCWGAPAQATHPRRRPQSASNLTQAAADQACHAGHMSSCQPSQHSISHTGQNDLLCVLI